MLSSDEFETSNNPYCDTSDAHPPKVNRDARKFARKVNLGLVINVLQIHSKVDENPEPSDDHVNSNRHIVFYYTATSLIPGKWKVSPKNQSTE
ncbi:hypothetical protein BELL_0285g00050 [Botrytis elliptica]|uniref:Uncharacterized protein n=1 Tax=Botrytis elliptica TaxID=278938 RepID=A0A4Z1JLB9_9HELO|nr:hypothetical protein BELL_0285g00050 [Botrytis elliptica]